MKNLDDIAAGAEPLCLCGAQTGAIQWYLEDPSKTRVHGATGAFRVRMPALLETTSSNSAAGFRSSLSKLNRVDFVGYVGDVSSSFFGKAVAANPPRSVQLLPLAFLKRRPE
jgi:hypothetical protein